MAERESEIRKGETDAVRGLQLIGGLISFTRGIYFYLFIYLNASYFLKTRIFVPSDFSHFRASLLGSAVVHCVPALRWALC